MNGCGRNWVEVYELVTDISFHNPTARFVLGANYESLNAISEAFYELSVLKQFEIRSKPFIHLDLHKALAAFRFAREANARLTQKEQFSYTILREHYMQKVSTGEESRWDDIFAYFTIMELLKDYGMLNRTEEVETEINDAVKLLLPDIKEQWRRLQVDKNFSVDTMEFFSTDYIKLQDRDIANFRMLYAYIFDEDIKKVFGEVYNTCNEASLAVAINMQRFFIIDEHKVFKILSKFPGIEQYMPEDLRVRLSHEINEFLESFYNDAFNEFIVQYAAVLDSKESNNSYGEQLMEMGLTDKEEYNAIMIKINKGEFK